LDVVEEETQSNLHRLRTLINEFNFLPHGHANLYGGKRSDLNQFEYENFTNFSIGSFVMKDKIQYDLLLYNVLINTETKNPQKT
jgi:hypothetical protein